MQCFHTLIQRCVREGFSDIHITGGYPLVYRSHGHVQFDSKVRFSHADVDLLANKLLDRRQKEILRHKWSVDFALSVEKIRLRMNVFKTTRGLSMAIRLLSGNIPSIEQLNLHPSLRDFCKERAGLLLICGPTGSGKSTTIATLLKEIIEQQQVHVVTLEDPIEYRFQSARSFIEQRELGTHVHSFEQGLIDVLREDPDVIVVGELRDMETIRLTLNAAESGHLVISTLHASNVEDALYRICNSFPNQDFVRYQLSSALIGIVVQRLTYMERARFRVPLLSIMRNNRAITGLIRENKFTNIENTMMMSRKAGMFSEEQYLTDYLENITNFSPPSRVFQPSSETDEPIYESPLTTHVSQHNYDPGATASMAIPQAASPVAEPMTRPGYTPPVPSTAKTIPTTPPSRAASGLGDELAGNTYCIDEGEDLASLVKTLK